jgi:hypothetical protein
LTALTFSLLGVIVAFLFVQARRDRGGAMRRRRRRSIATATH